MRITRKTEAFLISAGIGIIVLQAVVIYLILHQQKNLEEVSSQSDEIISQIQHQKDNLNEAVAQSFEEYLEIEGYTDL
jgi:uncharacterized protein YpmS